MNEGNILKIASLAFFLVLGIVFTGMSQTVKEPSLARFIPEDAVVCAEITDYSTLKGKWDTSALKKYWDEPNVQKAATAFKDRINVQITQLEDKIGVSIHTLFELFPHGIAGVLTTFDTIMWQGSPVEEFEYALIARYDKKNISKIKSLVERYFKDLPSDAKKSKFKVKGATIYSIEWRQILELPDPETTPLSSGSPGSQQRQDKTIKAEFPLHAEYAFVKDYFVIGEGRHEPTKKIVSRIAGVPGLSSLAESGKYTSCLSKFPGKQDILVYIDTHHVTDVMMKSLEQPSDSDESILPPFARVQSFLLGGNISDEGVDLQHTLTISGKNGEVGGIVDSLKENSFDLLKLAPQDAELFFCVAFDFKKVWAAFDDTARARAGTQAGGIPAMVAMLNLQLGVDIERDLIDSLGNEMCIFSSKGTGETVGKEESGGFIIALKDSAGFKTFLDKVLLNINKMAPVSFEEKPFQGYTIYVPRAPEGAERTSVEGAFSIAGHYFVAGPQLSDVKDIISKISGKKLPDLSQNEGLIRMMKHVPQKGYWLGYGTGRYANELVSPLGFVMGMVGNFGMIPLEAIIPLNKIMSKNRIFRKYFTGSVSRGIMFPDGIYDHTFFEAKN